MLLTGLIFQIHIARYFCAMSSQLQFTVERVEDLDKLALTLLDFAGDEHIIAFEGEMGAGKTTFIKSICKALGVLDITSSPTFSIVNHYLAPRGNVYHFDFYRLNDPSEALAIGVDEYFSDGSFCLIEWPEKVGNLLPSGHVKVRIEPLSSTTRTITFYRP